MRAVLSTIGFALLSIVLSACLDSGVGQVPDVPTEAASTVLPAAVGVVPNPEAVLSRLTEAVSIKIEDDWTGLSPLAPLEAVMNFELRKRKADLQSLA
jgi:hypothetical protein